MLALSNPSPEGDGAPAKGFRVGIERAVSPSATLERVKPLMGGLGITRVANLTGLDRIGIPVAAAYRPNSRSLSVSQGKGVTVEAAQASAVMEALECHHAERIEGPLLWGSHREMRDERAVADVTGIPKNPLGVFHDDRAILWVPGTDLLSARQVLVPYEVTHLDFRRPLPAGSGSFLVSSNGLASGNDLLEAISHALCELVERDANTLWHLSGRVAQLSRRIDLSTVDDETSRWLLDRFENADVGVAAWDTTTDVGIPSILCTVADRDRNASRPMPAVSGSGCHPRRAIALARALTEAAQGRLTIISGSRDDLSSRTFDPSQAVIDAERAAAEWGSSGARSFREMPDVEHDTFESDVRWELRRLADADLQEAIAVNLTKQEFGHAVVRMIVPHLEGISELANFTPGRRARRVMAERSG